MSDETEETGIVCSICFHSLDHELYDIKLIPTICMPACIVCFDSLRRKRAFWKDFVHSNAPTEWKLAVPDTDDMCSWCRRDDQGTLFLCANEEYCSHQFCESCVSNNLGNEWIDNITNDDEWQCFVCNPLQLVELQKTCRIFKEKSCYYGLEITNDDNEKAKIMFHILEGIVEEVNTRSLECDEYIIQCETEIGCSLSLVDKKKEIASLREMWNAHFAILEMQNSILSDALNDMGYGREISNLHKSYIQKQACSSSSGQERFMRLSAMESLQQVPLLDENRSIHNSAPVQVEYEEPEYWNSEDSDDSLEVDPSIVISDFVVQKYETEEDLKAEDFPREFARKVPLNVLKALYHAYSDDDKEHLIKTFQVPRYIAIVMNYASEEFPVNVNEWSIRKHFHPKVLQALYYAKTPPEQAILGCYYRMASDLTGVINFDRDETDDSVCDEEERTQFSNKHRRRVINTKLERLAIAEESREDQAFIRRVESSILATKRNKRSSRSKELLRRMKRLKDVTSQTVAANTIPINLEPKKSNETSSASINFQTNNDSNSDYDSSTSSVFQDEIQSDEYNEDIDEDCDGMLLTALPNTLREYRNSRMEKAGRPVKSQVLSKRTVRNKENYHSKVRGSTVTISSIVAHSDSNKSNFKEDRKILKRSKDDLIDLTLGDEMVSDDSILEIIKPPARTKTKTNFFSLQLTKETNIAREIEKRRRQEMLAFRYFPSEGGLVINEKRPEDDVAIAMVDHFVQLLKPHQLEGIRFLWENTMKSIAAAKKEDDETYGCILAHCMGLGKTFTVIAFLVTLLANPTIRAINDPIQEHHSEDCGFAVERPKPLLHRVLIITPKNVLHNWAKEVHFWTPPELIPLLNITTIDSEGKGNHISRKLQRIRDWYVKGGILVISFEMFRNLVTEDMKTGKLSTNDKKVYREEAEKYLLNPGPDLVVADEAHIIKNHKSKISEAVSAIRTKRRIALTGTPLQNHLEEYWCMVHWVKKRFLYSSAEFNKLFILPIKAGEAKDALPHLVRAMKKRSHALHTRLSEIVHRKDQSELSRTINKREFIITTRMTGFQKFLYKLFLSKLRSSRKARLFRCFQALMRICNHPVNMVVHSEIWKDVKNTSKKSLSKSYLSLKYISKQLKPVYDHFKGQSSDDIAKLEEAADIHEENFLRDPDAPIRTSRRRRKFKKLRSKRRRLLINSDDSEDSCSENGIYNRSFSTRKIRNEIDYDSDCFESDDEVDDSDSSGYSIDNDCDNDDEGSDYNDCDVSEDVNEFEGGFSFGNRKRKRKNTMTSENHNSINNDHHHNKKRLPVSDSSSSEECSIDNESVYEVCFDGCDDNDMNSMKVDTCAPVPIIELIEDDSGEENAASAANVHYKVQRKVIAGGIGASHHDHDITVKDFGVKEVGDTVLQSKVVGSGIVTNCNELVELIEDEDENDSSEEERPDELEPHWWKVWTVHNDEELSAKELLNLSNKMVTVLALLALTIHEREKMIIFSQSLYTLDTIEQFLMLPNWGRLVNKNNQMPQDQLSNWSKGVEYLRIDGSTGNRQPLIDKFNDPNHNDNCHLMLISTKAGNMGINLQAANRLVLFDCSWNPMHDLQAIYRAYRVGQKKDVFVYRLLSEGTMEEKIYKKQVAKMARANRVVDAQMPSNAFTEQERSELLRFEDIESNDANVAATESAHTRLRSVLQEGTQDKVLSRFLECFGTALFSSIENHDSFLADDSAEHLDLEEKKSAELEFLHELHQLRHVTSRHTAPSATTAMISSSLNAAGAFINEARRNSLNFEHVSNSVSSSSRPYSSFLQVRTID